MAIGILTAGAINPELNILGALQQLNYNQPVSTLQVNNIYIPTSLISAQTNLEFRNKLLSGFRWIHTTSSTDTYGSLVLTSFINNSSSGTNLIGINSSGVGIYPPLLFYNSTGTNYVALKAGSLSANTTWTLPIADGTSGQALITNGLGTLSWGSTGGGGSVTSITAGTGLSGGTITASGTISLITPVSLANGGTNANLTASNGGIFYSTASAGAILAGTATAGQLLLSGLSSAPSWSTVTHPSTTIINQILYSSANNVIAGLATANSGVLITSSGGVPSISSTLPTAVQGNITSLGTVTSGTWNGTAIAVSYGGTGNTSATAYSVLCGGTTSTGAFQSVASVGTSGQVLTSQGASSLPIWNTPSGGTVISISQGANIVCTPNPITGSGTVALNPILTSLTSVAIGTSSVGSGRVLTIGGSAELGTSAGDYRDLRIGGGNSSGYIYGQFNVLGDGIHIGYNYYVNNAGTSIIPVAGGATSRLSLQYGQITLAIGGVNTPPSTVGYFNSSSFTSNNPVSTNVGTSIGGSLHYILLNGGVTRWGIGLQNSEAGSNGGSDFSIYGYSDGGGFLNNPVTIRRNTGNIGINTGNPVTNLDINGNVRRLGNINVTETITAASALSTSQDSIIDTRNSSYTITLANASFIDQIKSVRLLTRNSLIATIQCNKGSFDLTSSSPIRNLYYGSNGWECQSSYNSNCPDSFYCTTQQDSKLIGSGYTGAARQGISGVLSSDGNTLAIGGSSDNTNIGAVWVFTRSGSAWIQQGSKLVGTGYTGASNQGRAVSLSADGNTLAIGGYTDNSNIGAVWVFTRSGSTWTQQGSKLVGTGYTGTPNQGSFVALSSDGNTLAIGGTGDNSGIGATWIFTRSGTTWTQQGSKLVGSGNTGASNQGQSVALSADGNTLAIGGLTDNSNIGATWVFTRSAGAWSQQGSKLVGLDNTGAARQGQSVSLSSDGNTLAIGGYSDNSGIGAAWVFSRSGTTWSQQQAKLVGTGYTGTPNQGSFVALSSDGNTLATGGGIDNSSIGATWIFTRFGSTAAPIPWTQQGSKLVGAGYAGTPNQGNFVALSTDGNILAIGGPNNNSSIGTTWIFTRSGTTWSQQQGSKLVGSGNTGAARQGQSVALSADGNTLAIGGLTDNTNIGAVWVFTRSGSAWIQQAKLVGTGYTGTPNQGQSVALSADGNILAIGGTGDNTNIGATWIFTRSGSTWTQQGSKLVGTGYTGTTPNQGVSVALSADGNTLAIGGYFDSSAIGAIWVFTRSGTTWTQQAKLVGTGYTGVSFIFQGSSVALSADGNTLAIGGTGDNSGIGATWVFTRSGSTWTQQGSKLVGTGYTGTPNQGSSVALSADGNTLATGGTGDNSNIGATWVFTRSGSTWTQQAKLVGTGYTGTPRQGYSVALSADGFSLAVGGYNDNSGIGAVWTYYFTNGNWIQKSFLIPSDNTGGASFGWSVRYNSNANTLAIGGYSDNSNIGATWVFS